MDYNSCKVGYIYIYKCVVGNVDNICKIGKTTHFRDKHCRIVQSIRTPYFGFMPYMTFDGEPIVTAFKVKDVDTADVDVQNHLRKKQVSSLEIYVGDYKELIKDLYKFLIKKKQLIELLPDVITNCDFLPQQFNVEDCTDKSAFEAVKEMIFAKYDEFPSKALTLLRDAKDFEEHCSSHYRSGNYIHFTDDLVLDLHISKAKRFAILTQLKDLL